MSCWGSGEPLREFLHADDLGDACVFALEKWSALSMNAPKDDQGVPLSFINVGTGIDLSIRELAEQVAETVGYRGKINWDTSKPDGTPRKQLNVNRLSKLGWSARNTTTGRIKKQPMKALRRKPPQDVSDKESLGRKCMRKYIF